MKKSLKRGMISGLYSSTYQAQRVKPEPESKHHKVDPLSGREDPEMGGHTWSWCSCPQKHKPDDHVRILEVDSVPRERGWALRAP